MVMPGGWEGDAGGCIRSQSEGTNWRKRVRVGPALLVLSTDNRSFLNADNRVQEAEKPPAKGK
ncbi:MAG: hypothetical protein CMJ81_21690 [Planctomycetaceae bacterium]|nr:hypothetical protein [Planctomycetaceae bacterium]MBP60847.1 hypothetical protein [Planctomycetaceae bacterium]